MLFGFKSENFIVTFCFFRLQSRFAVQNLSPRRTMLVVVRRIFRAVT